MIGKKVFNADGVNTRFLSDFIIQSEQFARVYAYIYDNTLNPDGTEDKLQDGTTDHANWVFPTNVWKRGADAPNSAQDLLTIEKWDLVNNSIATYLTPLAPTKIWIEVATTPEEFGSTLIQPTVAQAEAAAATSIANRVLTDADVALTHADVVLTHADVVLTHADVLLTNADAASTAADVVLTHADVALTHADVVLTHADVLLTNADAASTAADVLLTNADVVLTHADVVLAETAQVAAELAYDSFDDRYLGSKASDPTLDNDGNALLTGALYWNTTVGQMRVYSGAVWNNIAGGGATGGGVDKVFIENEQVITTDYTLTTGMNALSTGDITINTGITVTVPTGARWVIA